MEYSKFRFEFYFAGERFVCYLQLAMLYSIILTAKKNGLVSELGKNDKRMIYEFCSFYEKNSFTYLR